MEKTRLDVMLLELGMVPSREQARGLIMAGQVYVNNQKADKPGAQVSSLDHLEIRGNRLPFVSRGGLKLDKAVRSFQLRLKDMVAMDIGASTGGFTDCMLQNGAKKVYAVDVGYGQLAWKLRTDPRVVNMERTNIRNISQDQIPEKLDFFSVDVAFISLRLVLPVALRLLKEGGTAVCLVKPQFEAGRENVGKKGVVRDPKVHQDVLESICTYVKEIGFTILGADFSPVKGPEGNIEYLLYIKKSQDFSLNLPIDIADLVVRSHLALDGGDKS